MSKHIPVREMLPTAEEWLHINKRKEEIKANPLATHAELYVLSTVEQLQHPNCPVEFWWFEAQEFGMEAEQSVLFPILTLESPERWAYLERNFICRWIEYGLARLGVTQRILFGTDCAERTLPIWEATFPVIDSPRKAVQARRDYANGLIDGPAWYKAKQGANAAAAFARELYTMDCVVLAAETTCVDAAREVCDTAANAFGWVAEAYGPEDGNHSAWSEACWQERRWQWSRMKQYLGGNS